MDRNITSERFIELFITLKQLQCLGDNKDSNLYNLEWSFSTKLLSEFIFHSKKDYRYRDFLSCFNFNGSYSLNLISALNRSLQKHLLTGIYDDIAYISRYYTNFHILESNKEYMGIMQEFISNFDFYSLDQNLYLKNSEIYQNEGLQEVGNNNRLIFDLQRRVVRKYIEEEK